MLGLRTTFLEHVKLSRYLTVRNSPPLTHHCNHMFSCTALMLNYTVGTFVVPGGKDVKHDINVLTCVVEASSSETKQHLQPEGAQTLQCLCAVVVLPTMRCFTQVQLALWPNQDFLDKKSKLAVHVLPLEALLNYNEDDTKESHFEVSLFAELFKEMLQHRYARGLLRALAILDHEVRSFLIVSLISVSHYSESNVYCTFKRYKQSKKQKGGNSFPCCIGYAKHVDDLLDLQ